MGALEGLKILDFTTLLPGPLATLMLADWGAEAARDEHLKSRGMWPELRLPLSDKKVVQPGIGIKLDRCPPSYRHAAYPEGYNTEEFIEKYADRK